jgi:hypothetical protein
LKTENWVNGQGSTYIKNQYHCAHGYERAQDFSPTVPGMPLTFLCMCWVPSWRVVCNPVCTSKQRKTKSKKTFMTQLMSLCSCIWVCLSHWEIWLASNLSYRYKKSWFFSLFSFLLIFKTGQQFPSTLHVELETAT